MAFNTSVFFGRVAWWGAGAWFHGSPVRATVEPVDGVGPRSMSLMSCRVRGARPGNTVNYCNIPLVLFGPRTRTLAGLCVAVGGWWVGGGGSWGCMGTSLMHARRRAGGGGGYLDG